MLQQLGNIDLYLLDQLMKKRIHSDMRILDAGCGEGRNTQYFIQNNFDIHGVDRKPKAIAQLKAQLPHWNPNYDSSKFQVADIKALPYPDHHFDFIISNAVLHFAENRTHFLQLLKEHIRVLAPNGIFWFRMTTKHTLEEHARQLVDDVYALPDGSTRYLLDRKVLAKVMQEYGLQFLDPFKTVNVSDLRTMVVVVVQMVR